MVNKVSPEEKATWIEDQKKAWKENIGKYNIKDANGNAISPPESIQKVDAILTNPKAKSKLFEGCPPENQPEKTKAREAFVDYMLSKVFDVTKQANNIRAEQISMDKLLDAEGKKLYKAAIKEEHNSRAFRAANVLKGHTFVPGDPPKVPVSLKVLGPSASGKSTASDQFVQNISKSDQIATNPNSTKKGNDFVAIDGAIERELSQVSSLIFQVATKNLGYQGVKGLEKTGLDKIKTYVKSATKKQPDVSVVTPLTYATEGAGSHISEALVKARLESQMAKEQKKAEKDGRVFIVGAVKPPSDSKEDIEKFRGTVGVMGNKRAWVKPGEIKPKDLLLDPQAKNTAESKAYGAENFTNGLDGSRLAEEAYKSTPGRSIFLEYRNDLVAKRKVGNDWVDTTPEDVKNARKTGDTKLYFESALLSARDFDKWQNHGKVNTQNLTDKEKQQYDALSKFKADNNLGEWAKYCLDNKVSPPIIKVDLPNVQMQRDVQPQQQKVTEPQQPNYPKGVVPPHQPTYESREAAVLRRAMGPQPPPPPPETKAPFGPPPKEPPPMPPGPNYQAPVGGPPPKTPLPPLSEMPKVAAPKPPNDIKPPPGPPPQPPSKPYPTPPAGQPGDRSSITIGANRESNSPGANRASNPPPPDTSNPPPPYTAGFDRMRRESLRSSATQTTPGATQTNEQAQQNKSNKKPGLS